VEPGATFEASKSKGRARARPFDRQEGSQVRDYFTVTVAPTSANFALMASPSSLLTPSFMI